MPEFRDIYDGLKVGAEAHFVHGLVPGAATSLASALHHYLGETLMLLVPGNSEAAAMAADAAAWLGDDAVELLVPMDFMPEPEAIRSRDVEAARLRTLGRLVEGDPLLIVASLPAVERRLPPRDALSPLIFEIRRGMEIEPGEILAALESLGYSRESMVEIPGSYTQRGGIIDFAPPTMEHPVRVEFFGDRVDGIRVFDPHTQRSLENLSEVLVSPASENLAPGSEGDLESAAQAMERDLHRATEDLARRGLRGAADRLEKRIQRQVAGLRSGLFSPNRDPLFPYVCGQTETIFDYLPDGASVLVWNPVEMERLGRGRARELGERRERLVSDGTIMPRQMDIVIDHDTFELPPHDRPRAYLSTILGKVEGETPAGVVRMSSRTPEPFYGQWEMLRTELRRWRQDGRQVVIAAPDEGRARGIEGILGEDAPRVEISPLGRGFELPGGRLIVIAEQEIRGKSTVSRGFRLPRGRRSALSSYEELRDGDYVVHRHHGIGQYLGLSTREVSGVERDYLTLRYAEGDRLYVPADAIDLVHKYSSGDGEPPRIYRLGSGEWSRIKARVKDSVRDLTRELLELYSARDRVEGHAFPPEGPWEVEFRESFPHEDTPDQAEATREVARAMERARPMDFLLCGDVGYGKTEVAFRAAFKAMADSKQVVFLVPTTVLAQQHYHTALERFAGWPFKISLLSRFRSTSEQERTIAGLRRGTIDMVIGTHRLLGSDVGFRDLGLMIVDEEHRFGVGHKEKLKELRTSVDVLTLSATPIPRTLHMALSGIRDVSMIETPPEDRLPVVTYVMEYDTRLVADAIHREMERGGQVFYVHNRVRSIHVAARRVERMAPAARIGVAHGQMAESQLEAVMEEFARGDLDVLVCTTIIESGLDMPSVNTLIVEDAERLGLAQLYQLRGRVGRSDRLAYAYLTYRSGEVLTGPAADRLHALREFTDLGSGLRLAKRDLEIRGAGNVLGAEQHGFMLAVGFELYTRFLEESAEEFLGEGHRPVLKPVLELSVDAHIPREYVPEGAERVALYRRLGDLDEGKDLSDLLDEILDRFGDPPEPVINLVDLAELRILASERGVIRIAEADRNALVIEAVARESDPGWGVLAEDMNMTASVRGFTGGRRVWLRPRRPGEPRPTIGKLRDMLRRVPTLDEI